MIDTNKLFSLQGKKALVTGASTGLGRAIAEHFAAAGADLCMVARGKDELETTAASLRAYGTRVLTVAGSVDDARVRDESIARCVNELGGLDILVNNAGVTNVFGPLVNTPPEDVDRQLHTNLKVPLYYAQAAWKARMSEHGGAIVNITSFSGLRPRPNVAVYGASKAALDQLTRSMAQELSPKVRVNAVAAGMVMTERKIERAKDPNFERKSTLAASANRPMKRHGAPSDIAPAVLYLCSDASSWVTGTVLVVDGGGMVAV